MTLPRWNEERTDQLKNAVGNESPVSRDTVARVAGELETTPRSISSKLRKLGYEVQPAGAAPAAFSEARTEELREFVEANRGAFTYGQLAENFAGGEFSAKQIQGKLLSMELHDAVAPTPKAETQKTYTDAEEAEFLKLAKANKYVEEIADALGKSVNSVRGKALSLLRAGQISAIPAQRDVKGATPDAFDALGNVSGLTVAEIAEKLSKTERGIKTLLTRRGVTVKDYDGAAKREKAQAAA